jgi:uncharacterized membrane protein YoaK (UPF0700 family)
MLDRVLDGGDEEQLRNALKLVAGFCVGCVLGAAALALVGHWAWSLPVMFAAVAVARTVV